MKKCFLTLLEQAGGMIKWWRGREQRRDEEEIAGSCREEKGEGTILRGEGVRGEREKCLSVR